MTARYACKGCGKPIIVGQLRRGDDWHADCHTAARPNFDARQKLRWEKPQGKKPSGLTDTQFIILDAAEHSPAGSVVFSAGDRKGTRVAAIDDLGRPIIIAYSNPEYFLMSRGMLERTNERHVYRITDAGRAKLRRAA